MQDITKIRQLANDRLADVIVDATGNHHSMVRAFEFAAFAGRVVYVGITQSDLQFPHAVFFHRRELTLLASRNAMPGDFRRIVHYGMEQVGLSLAEAQSYNIVAMVIFLCSRWVCTALLRYYSPGRMLTTFACGAFAFTAGAIYLPGNVGLISLVMVSACMSLMFPTIYGISLHSLTKEESKLGSAFLIMAIVGGAVLTKFQGELFDSFGVRESFWLPAACFVLIAVYGIRTFAKFERDSPAPA